MATCVPRRPRRRHDSEEASGAWKLRTEPGRDQRARAGRGIVEFSAPPGAESRSTECARPACAEAGCAGSGCGEAGYFFGSGATGAAPLSTGSGARASRLRLSPARRACHRGRVRHSRPQRRATPFQGSGSCVTLWACERSCVDAGMWFCRPGRRSDRRRRWELS
jgi:hypothetical protein